MGVNKHKSHNTMTAPTRFENRLRADEKRKTLIERMLARGKLPEPRAQSVAAAPVPIADEQAPEPAAQAEPQPESPFAKARCGQANIAILDRGAPSVELRPEPWLARVVDAALQTAAKSQLRLALVWPGTISSVALVHALATIERLSVGDKRGLRALLYPTKRPSFAVLNQLLLEREKLIQWARCYLTISPVPGAHLPIEGRDDQNKDMLLMAVQSAHNQDPALAPPSMAEVLPHFDWDIKTGGWGVYDLRFLTRTKRALQRAHRRELWKDSDGRIAKLGNPKSAPDALFGVSHLATAKEWKAALNSKELKEGGQQPELVLIDLTKEIRRTANRNLIRHVPDVVDEVREKWKEPVGFLIITDDPRTYFTLRKQFIEKAGGNKDALVCDPIVSMGEDYGLAQEPLPADWAPATVANKHFHVGVLDHEMVEAAVRFWNIGQSLEQDSAPHRALREAAMFLLLLANLPGGYRDYIAWMESSAFADAIRAEMTWNGHMAKLQGLADRGEFDANAEAVHRAVFRATKLVEAYNDETPIAKRIAKELDLCLARHKACVAVVLRFNHDVSIARAFLTRYAGFPKGQSFAAIADRVYFITHKEIAGVLTSGQLPTKFIFVGMPDETLKVLLTSERVPADSVVLLDWRRANDVLTGLRSLQTVPAYKPFRGRIAELGDEIERRIRELPKAIDIEKLGTLRVPQLSLSATASEASRRADDPPNAYKLQLEDGSRVIVGHRVYIYDPDEEEPFHQRNIENVHEGDLVFVMSEELKDLFEVRLIEAGHGIARGSSFGEMLRNYHRDVLTNSKRIFGDLRVASLARKIHERMVELRPDADCSLSRIRYWVDVEGSSDTAAEDLKPHSTWAKGDFETFARALEIPENLISVYWLMVTGQRRALQQAGRELAERYAHVLFNEEAAELHYRLKRETVRRLQHEAVLNTYRVVRVIPPLKKEKAVGNS